MDALVNLANDEIWTFDELAKVLKMPKQSLYEMTRARGQIRHKHPIPFIVLGGHRRFLKSQIEAWIARSAVAGRGEL